MIDRINDIIIDAIHPIPIIPFFAGLTRTEMSQVSFRVDFIVDFIIMAPPIADFHFIVGVESRRVENVYIARFVRCAGVPFPEIGVDERWADGAAVAFESAD